ncbi:MAG: hypothetical protein ACRYG8_00055 [Janthinobacterium lividum]
MNGLELVGTIRFRLGDQAPSIILTSRAQTHIVRSHGDLFAAMFDKPFRIADILRSMQTLIGPAFAL